jgi:hypothetical protein
MARQYKTLGEMRADMRSMLGFGAVGASAGPNAALVDLHLRNAQTMLYWAHDWAHLRRYEVKDLGANATLVDYPASANPDRVKSISVLRGTVWSPPLPKGIKPELYTTQASTSDPKRWEPYEQIEIWPRSDQIYPLRIFFIRALLPLNGDTDRATLDDTNIELISTATLKAHYRQPDAQLAKDAADGLLMQLKARSWGQSVFRAKDYESEALPRPIVV